MSGKVHWISIYDVNNYNSPATIQKVLDYLENTKYTLENSKEWSKKQRAKELFYGNPEGWWDIRRRGRRDNLIPRKNDITNCIEIPLKELEDEARCDRIYDWLHDEENLTGDVYVSHYARTVPIEITRKWSVGGTFFSKKSKDTIQEIQVPCIGLVFMEKTDTIRFKLACM